jgi:hypothetical protein
VEVAEGEWPHPGLIGKARLGEELRRICVLLRWMICGRLVGALLLRSACCICVLCHVSPSSFGWQRSLDPRGWLPLHLVIVFALSLSFSFGFIILNKQPFEKVCEGALEEVGLVGR